MNLYETTVSDIIWMRRALELAKLAHYAGDVPVGAIVVKNGQVLATGYNQREVLSDPTAHAEVIAVRQASKTLEQWRLDGATLYVTLEPCAMCAGAIVNSRLERLVFGAKDPKGGACGSLFNVPADPRVNHRVSITSGILEDESIELLQNFFGEKRRLAKETKTAKEKSRLNN